MNEQGQHTPSSALGIALMACFVILVSAPYAYGQEPDAGRGEQLAARHCSRCHVIPGRNNMGIGSTPSFKIMVKSELPNWRDNFEAFYSLAPHPAFVTIQELRTERSGPAIAAPIFMSLRQVDDLMAYVDELAKKLRKP